MCAFGLPQRGLFVTGTDTEVGKTYVAVLLARRLQQQHPGQVGVYKPVASGCTEQGGALMSEDADQLWAAAGRPLDLLRVCPQYFAAPLAPPVAAAQAGQTVNEQLLIDGLDAWKEFPLVLVEGAGGLMSPLGEKTLNLDVAQACGFPLLIVAANRLGVLNHVLLTLEVAHSRGLPAAAVVLNDVESAGDASRASNLVQLRGRCPGLPVLPLAQHAGELPDFHWERLLLAARRDEEDV